MTNLRTFVTTLSVSLLLLVFRSTSAALAEEEMYMPQRLTGIYCNSSESAEYVASQLERVSGFAGVHRAHVAMHVQNGRTGSARHWHHGWCEWTSKYVLQHLLFEQPLVRGKLYQVVLPIIGSGYNAIVDDTGVFYVGGTSLSPDTHVDVASHLFPLELNSSPWDGPVITK